MFIFEFQASWNNFAGAADLPELRLAGAVHRAAGHHLRHDRCSPRRPGGQGDYQYVMVASLLVTVPMLLLFAFGQRYFIEGIASPGVKG